MEVANALDTANRIENSIEVNGNRYVYVHDYGENRCYLFNLYENEEDN